VLREESNSRFARGFFGALDDWFAQSVDAAMRYLALSLGIAAVVVWLTPVRSRSRRKLRDRKSPPDRH
jgi:hypothetical protein